MTFDLSLLLPPDQQHFAAPTSRRWVSLTSRVADGHLLIRDGPRVSSYNLSCGRRGETS